MRNWSRPCEECGEGFTPRRADARFCKNKCRQKAYRKRKAAARYASDRSRNTRGTAKGRARR